MDMNTKNVLCLSPFEFRECLAIISCMGERDFIEIFGSADYRVHGYHCYQWNKFEKEYDKDVAKWVCYLDGGNLTLLATYLRGRIERYRKPEERTIPELDEEGRRLKGRLNSLKKEKE